MSVVFKRSHPASTDGSPAAREAARGSRPRPRRFGAIVLSGMLLAGLGVMGGALLLSPSSASAAEARRAPQSVIDWSNAVWNAAKASDSARVDELLSKPPEDIDGAALKRLRELVEHRNENIRATQRSIEEEIGRKRAELRRALDANDMTRAMLAAANLKFLCKEWVCELEQADVAEAIRRAEQIAERAEQEGDLLLAQEMFFRLRGLYESTTEAAKYRQWDARLDTISRRIGLMASYAPKQLAELRTIASNRVRASARAAAQAAADEAIAEGREPDASTQSALKEAEEEAQLARFQPTGDEWRDEVRSINEGMLTESLRRLAGDHVSNTGWMPLLAGSLDAMELLGSTPALSETFPKLGDETARARWLEAVKAQQARLAATGPESVGRRTYESMLAALRSANRDSLELPEEVLLKEFGDGATHVLARDQEDPYSEIIWPERVRRFRQSVDGKLIGVGIQIRFDDKRDIMVSMPLEGSPAMRAGIRPEDRIVAVDGEPTLGWSLNRAVDKITGRAGEAVALTVRRADESAENGERLITFSLERQPIKLRSVHGWWKDSLDRDGNPVWRWYIDPDASIGYVRLTSFTEESIADFNAALRQMESQGGPLRGLILDLRSNPGGLLQSAVEFVNMFVERGEIVSCQDRLGQKVPRMTRSAQPHRAVRKGLPLVVLINEGSASASEIVAGSLRAHGAAVVVGQRTFGKGSVQEVASVSVPGADAQVKYTTHHYVLPGDGGMGPGRLVHKKPGATDWGVDPHLQVRMSPDQIERSTRLRNEADSIDDQPVAGAAKDRPDVNDLLTKGYDPQLETAVLVLGARVLRDLEEARIAKGTP
ncbi:MAG: PDZ domain-containing protein [Phycisphaeraceae bacterium]|nr:PDZ domain-containing protein [Phycisphaeraceae bacterium]